MDGHHKRWVVNNDRPATISGGEEKNEKKKMYEKKMEINIVNLKVKETNKNKIFFIYSHKLYFMIYFVIGNFLHLFWIRLFLK